MHVDFVINELNIGGAERCLTELACGLQGSAHKVRVFSLGPLPVGDQRQLVERLIAAGIPLASGDASRPYQFASCYRTLKAWLGGGRADICQTFLHHANVLGTFANRAVGSSLCIGGVRVAERKWLRCQLESFAATKMDQVVCVSDAVAEFAKTELRVDATRCRVIANSVDVSRFSTAKAFPWADLGWTSDSIVTLFVGRLHPQKGLELLQQQIDLIAPIGTQRRLLLVGDGELRPSLQKWADGLGRDRVQLIGWKAEVAPFLKASRMLVLPSHFEGMPNVVLEAFAAGLPVVCSRVEGSDELVSHSRELQSFRPGDSVAMAERIVRFASDPELSRNVGKANLARARRDFSIASMVDAYASLYRAALARREEPR